jgi:hypothetical protein
MGLLAFAEARDRKGIEMFSDIEGSLWASAMV